MTTPNLAGIIRKEDVYKKGTGNFSASYVPWARIAQLLHEHASGWDFHLKPTADGGLIHQARLMPMPPATSRFRAWITGTTRSRLTR